MNKQTIQEVEQRFLDLRKLYTESDWCNADVLNAKVDELINADLPLAYRLMQRVKNLEPGAESRRQMSLLKKQLLKEHPELLQLASTHSNRNDRIKEKVAFLMGKIKGGAGATSVKSVTTPIFIFVLIPFLLFAFYQIIWASERFESRTQLILKQPDGMSTLDPAMAILSGFGSTVATGNDNELLKAYILSTDMISHVEKEIGITRHYSDAAYDVFSRLTSEPTQEDVHKYFADMVLINVDAMSGVISILVQGFEPDFTQSLNKHIVERAEWYINEIGHSLAKEQLVFVENEHKLTEKRLQQAKSVLLTFQREYDLLDPEAEGMALQQIAYGLEAKVASKTAELRVLLSGMTKRAPAVLMVQSELDSLNEELSVQRSRLSNNKTLAGAENGESVGEILAQFADLKINLELALTAYTASQVSLEKSRIEAYRQLKYLIVVESPTLPEDATYPQVFYNLALFITIALMLFLIGRIVFATVKELR
jgi:capsular polysaccharide transport system permease protein